MKGNPFVGKDVNTAEDLADELLEALVKTCQRRPALPLEREEGYLFFLTPKGSTKYKAGYGLLKKQWEDAGFDSANFTRGPIRYD